MANIIELMDLKMSKPTCIGLNRASKSTLATIKASHWLISYFFRDFYAPVILNKSLSDKRFTINFAVPILKKYNMVFQIEFERDWSLISVRAKVCNEIGLGLVKSSEIMKSVCKSISLINSMISKLNFNLLVDVNSG